MFLVQIFLLEPASSSYVCFIIINKCVENVLKTDIELPSELISVNGLKHGTKV